MITKAQAQAQLDALLSAQSNNILTVTIGGRTVTFRDAPDLAESVNYWQRVVAGLTREAQGVSRHGMRVARFGCPE